MLLQVSVVGGAVAVVAVVKVEVKQMEKEEGEVVVGARVRLSSSTCSICLPNSILTLPRFLANRRCPRVWRVALFSPAHLHPTTCSNNPIGKTTIEGVGGGMGTEVGGAGVDKTC